MPAPTEQDIQLRSIRKPMTKQERKNFISLFLPGIVVIVTTYVLLTILRDFRDNFSNELYTELGYGNNASHFYYNRNACFAHCFIMHEPAHTCKK